ncbi:MAG: hypothetical protein ABW092_18560 [Candidatus Thiodiazotropha sp.]
MIKTLGLFALFITISVFHKVAMGDNHLYQFAVFKNSTMKNSECALVERFSQKKNNLLRYAGVIDEYACNVYIPKTTFEQKFEFCYQSGINLNKLSAGASFECFIQQTDEDIWILAHLSDQKNSDAQVMCYFSCVGK